MDGSLHSLFSRIPFNRCYETKNTVVVGLGPGCPGHLEITRALLVHPSEQLPSPLNNGKYAPFPLNNRGKISFFSISFGDFSAARRFVTGFDRFRRNWKPLDPIGKRRRVKKKRRPRPTNRDYKALTFCCERENPAYGAGALFDCPYGRGSKEVGSRLGMSYSEHT